LGAVSGAGVRLKLLGACPQRFFLIKRKVGETGFLLDCAETLLELAVSVPQSGFRFNVEMSCEVYDSEQKIAKLFQLALVIRFGVEFGQFLVDLRART